MGLTMVVLISETSELVVTTQAAIVELLITNGLITSVKTDNDAYNQRDIFILDALGLR